MRGLVVQGAMPICEGRVFVVFWKSKRCGMIAEVASLRREYESQVKMIRRVTEGKRRCREVFQQHRGVWSKEKLSRCGRNQLEVEVEYQGSSGLVATTWIYPCRSGKVAMVTCSGMLLFVWGCCVLIGTLVGYVNVVDREVMVKASMISISESSLEFKRDSELTWERIGSIEAPTRTDERLYLASHWLHIGKSNFLFDATKIHEEPIFQYCGNLAKPQLLQSVLAYASVLPSYILAVLESMMYDEKTSALLMSRKGKPLSNLVDVVDEDSTRLFLKEKVMILSRNWPRRYSLDASRKGEGEGTCWRRSVYGTPISETTPKLPEVVGQGRDKHLMIRQLDPLLNLKMIHQRKWCSSFSTVNSVVGISVRTEDQAGSDLGKAHEALAGPGPEPMQEDQTGPDSGKVHVSLAGPNPEHTDEEFLATAYPKVHENLKLITDEHVIEDNLESHSGSMSSMKNLEDTDNFGDQFLNDKPTEDDQEKSKVWMGLIPPYLIQVIKPSRHLLQ
ncbi:hypothetical protein Tco_0937126 [Tanacetum coccineum]|uniref:Uncharacterized protein n=1 Tax=Tanacetum coccineum TaxID=301880 RepID=A0ABQ5DG72_9ASTR